MKIQIKENLSFWLVLYFPSLCAVYINKLFNLIQIIAEETETIEKLSSTATLTVSITDANDNRPIFDQESYSISVSETAHAGQLIATITAKDLDSGHFGEQGIRYSISGTGANLFDVDPITGAITVAKCPSDDNSESANTLLRKKRQFFDSDEDLDYSNDAKNVNVTLVGKTGFIPVDISHHTDMNSDSVLYNVHHDDDDDDINGNYNIKDDLNKMMYNSSVKDEFNSSENLLNNSSGDRIKFVRKIGPGVEPCLDYESQSVYFLSYKVRFMNAIYNIIYRNIILHFLYMPNQRLTN